MMAMPAGDCNGAAIAHCGAYVTRTLSPGASILFIKADDYPGYSMERLRALAARYLACHRIDRIAVGVCAVLAAGAVVAIALSPGAPGSRSPEATADAPSVPAVSPSGIDLEMSKQLAPNTVPAVKQRRSAAASMPPLEPARGGASGVALLIALPVGVWLGFALARRRDAALPAPHDPDLHDGDRPGTQPASTNALVDEIDDLKRSLKRRDRRITALKKRLRPADTDENPAATVRADSVSHLEHELDQAREAIRRLEDLLQDKQDDWARSELITAHSDSRVAALEADLRAAGEIIESLHEDIGYWKRRAVESTPRDRVIKRLTG